MTDPDRRHPTPPSLTPEQARQGHIVLRSRWRRYVFFGGLIAFVLFVAVGGFFLR